MLKAKIDDSELKKDISNMIEYATGFLEGISSGAPDFLSETGISVIDALKQYIDSNARVSPQLLHHMYEWNQTGSPSSRLFDISYVVSGNTLSFMSTFRQSSSTKPGSYAAFYDKARIMEEGIPVTIVPKKKVLAFEDNGEEVFTSKPINISNPGGNVSGEYEKVFNSFFTNYFTQSYLESSGILAYLKSPVDFVKNMSKRSGRSKGVAVGRNWIAKAGRA